VVFTAKFEGKFKREGGAKENFKREKTKRAEGRSKARAKAANKAKCENEASVFSRGGTDFGGRNLHSDLRKGRLCATLRGRRFGRHLALCVCESYI